MSPPPDLMLSIEDIKIAGSKKLPKMAREFYNSGSTAQITVHENTTAYNKYRLRPRVLVDVSNLSLTHTLFNQTFDFPLGISPTGLQAMAHPDGELATSRAAAKRNIPMAVSSFATYPVEEIVDAAKLTPTSTPQPTIPTEKRGGPYAIQLYTLRSRPLQQSILTRAEKAGCRAIFLTADSPVLGVRYNETRNNFRTPPGLSWPMLNVSSEALQSQSHDSGFTATNSDSHSWAREIPWLRSVTNMEIWIKGVLTAEDVLLAREWGCDGVVVSNHGGRQLDGVVATVDALPECVRAAEGKIRVHVDGGVRSGVDVFKALALGAEWVWVGRPVVWGLAYDGEKGVSRVLDILYEEFKRCMQLTGFRTLKDITPAALARIRPDGTVARL
ncbi:FMN-dependent alpha-hydroxy acid dehydrogenase [Aspergillus sclerotioniger CBS 115572]|uniref:Oxidase FUB9 n=1 Tax=Aspergillus sclerotioniger CBS 115572 TaxID=1450535 RepID=A0A317WQQ2_9EURO|nr:FMN-dependent alpha-hydroxy acid dehydrogenase [Aspergillus sclerotioniger CBS 115572]PWY88834.1 FMN-dependent alpha-hydroxy acid dehydrogenase [Aspergillus sclerotioniger CBS 115572]